MKKRIFTVLFISVLSFMAFTACSRFNIKIVIEFESNGGTECAAVKSEDILSIKMPTNPTRADYIFDGWYWDDGVWEEPFTVNSIMDKPLSDYLNLKLYAKWNKAIVSVVFDSAGGTPVASAKETYNTVISRPENPTKKDNDFEGWYKEAACINAWDFENDKVKSDMTLYAKWSKNVFNVTFYKEIGSVYKIVQVTKGTTVPAPVEPQIENYSFLGWYRDADYSNEWDFSTHKVIEDLELYAKWAIDSHLVTFETNGGSAIQSLTIEHGSEISSPPLTTKNQYIFDGWYSNANLTGKALIFPLTVTGERKLYAKWAQYTQGLIFTAIKGGYQVEKGNINSSTSQIVIPSSYMGEPVIKIASDGFCDLVNLQSITIPNSITSIGNKAFSGNIALKSISIPSSVSQIGFSILSDCNTLNSLSLPYLGAEKDNADTSYLGYFFGAIDSIYNNEYVPGSLRSVTINGGSIVGDNAFLFCDSIAEIVLPRTLLTIGNSAFAMCDALETLIIPDGTRSIGGYAFHGFDPKLKILFIPSSVVEIGEYAFQISDLALRFERKDSSGMTLGEEWVRNTTDIMWGCVR